MIFKLMAIILSLVPIFVPVAVENLSIAQAHTKIMEALPVCTADMIEAQTLLRTTHSGELLEGETMEEFTRIRINTLKHLYEYNDDQAELLHELESLQGYSTIDNIYSYAFYAGNYNRTLAVYCLL